MSSPKEITRDFIDIKRPNQSIIIHQGNYTIVINSQKFVIKGKIWYEWLPNPGVCFSGRATKPSRLDLSEELTIFINNIELGKGFLTRIDHGLKQGIKGVITFQAYIGDKSIKVRHCRFSIPNLREFDGYTVLTQTNSHSRNRIVLENEKYLIWIDKCNDFKTKISKLEENGGYHITYGGQIFKNKGAITNNDYNDIWRCLDSFLSFLNGSRTSANFIQGLHKNEVLWTEYSTYSVDIFKNVSSWVPRFSVEGLNKIWQQYTKLWENENSRIFLITAIHWYLECNRQSGYAEGSIVMAQTALELIYNWWLIENKNLLLGKDSENINAANKIRLIINFLNITTEIPPSLKNLCKYSNESKIEDGPEVITQIRNSIVHSQEDKRKKVFNIDLMVKYQALQLSIWYIELSLLRILNYEFKYQNRCKTGNYIDTIEDVPWAVLVNS